MEVETSEPKKKNGNARYEKDFLTDWLSGSAGGGVQPGKGRGSSE